MAEEKDLHKALKLLRKGKEAEAVGDNSVIIWSTPSVRIICGWEAALESKEVYMREKGGRVSKKRNGEGGFETKDCFSTAGGCGRNEMEGPVCRPHTGSMWASDWRWQEWAHCGQNANEVSRGLLSGAKTPRPAERVWLTEIQSSIFSLTLGPLSLWLLCSLSLFALESNHTRSGVGVRLSAAFLLPWFLASMY